MSIIDDTYDLLSPTMISRVEENYNPILNAVEKRARNIARQFDRKKKAFEAMGTTIRESGTLNLSRLAYSKTSDELFSRKTYTPEGKSHGVYMLVDFSGSMSNVIAEVIEQAYMISRFCEIVRIPFRVVSYTCGNHFIETSNYNNQSTAKNYAVMFKNLAMVSLFTSNRSRQQNLKMFKLLSSIYHIRTNDYNSVESEMSEKISRAFGGRLGLGSTPTDEALFVAYGEVERMRQEHAIQYMNFVLLTDGIPNGVHFEEQKIVNPYNENREYFFTREDPSNGLKYSSYTNVTANLLDIYRDAGITTIGFFLDEIKGDLTPQDYVRRSMYADAHKMSDEEINETFKITKYKTSEFATSFRNIVGYDRFFFTSLYHSEDGGYARGASTGALNVISKDIGDEFCRKYNRKKR